MAMAKNACLEGRLFSSRGTVTTISISRAAPIEKKGKREISDVKL
jgi:hypothetical protein